MTTITPSCMSPQLMTGFGFFRLGFRIGSELELLPRYFLSFPVRALIVFLEAYCSSGKSGGYQSICPPLLKNA